MLKLHTNNIIEKYGGDYGFKKQNYFIQHWKQKIGGENPILIQSMSDIRTSNIEANIKLTNSLALYGLDMMRYSVLDLADAKALK